MKSLEARIKDTKPTLVVFQHAALHDAVKVKYMIKELKDKYGDKVNIISYDSSYNEPYKTHFRLSGFPTYILFKEGEELMRESGDKTVTQISELIERGF